MDIDNISGLDLILIKFRSGLAANRSSRQAQEADFQR